MKKKETKKTVKVLLPKVRIKKIYDKFNENWFHNKELKCCNCGKKNLPFYEIADLVTEDKSKSYRLSFVCHDCLVSSGYKRRFHRDNWVWMLR